LNESHHLLVKPCESVCVNLDAISARPAVYSFQLMVQLSKKSMWQPWWLRFFIYTLLMYTNTRSSRVRLCV